MSMIFFTQGSSTEYLLILFLKSAGKLHRSLLIVEEGVAFPHLLLETVLHFKKFLPVS